MSWSRIHGHDAVRDQLRTAYRRGRFAHAYLFTGPDGVGKKLVAIELAKALLCEAPPEELAACDRCDACVQVMAGTHPDCSVTRKPDDKLELPIDTIRQLCGTLGLKPARGSRKVAIVEDADDFNEESANAFLKSLEEPPPGTTLILLSTSPDAQLATIRSRCQSVPFAPLSADALRAILAERGVADRAQADRLIRLAGGSAGQAIALNDPAVWELRGALIDALGSSRFSSAPLAEKWSQFIEAKEPATQRLKASVALRLLADLLSHALHFAHGRSSDGFDSGEAEKLNRFGAKAGIDGLTELLEKCVEADWLVDRRVQLALVTELVVEKLGRAAA